MIEYPEAICLTKSLREAAVGKVIETVYPPSYTHKFCWFHGDVTEYDQLLKGRSIVDVQAVGIFVEIHFEEDYRLNFHDGVNVRLLTPEEKAPRKYQLMITFTDGCSLVFTVAMYGSINCYQKDFDNKYYIMNKSRILPLSKEFTKDHFDRLIAEIKPSASVKALLATEQRIPGLGNGVLQDILFHAQINPKKKVSTLTDPEREQLFDSIAVVLTEMIEKGGRDTEKNIHGTPGDYPVILSKNTYHSPCPRCGGEITKQAYMGGSVYFCSKCQPFS